MNIATIRVKDEVNVRIEGLTLSDRKRLNTKFKYVLPYARHIPAVKLGRWDGKIAFFEMSGMTYVNLLPEIIPELEKMGYSLNLEDERDYPQLGFSETDYVTEDSYSHIVWPKGHLHAGQPIKLRDYQIEIINGFLEDPQSIQDIATAAGKTVITAILSHKCEQYGRTFVIVPNKGLVTQTETDYINLGLDVGVYYGDRKEFNCTHTICTWQSLNNLMKLSTDILDEFISGVCCIMIDEVHQAKADVLKKLLTGPFRKITIRWGLTGTIPKEEFEKAALLTGIGPVTKRISAVSLQEKGYLAKCHVNIIQLMDVEEFPDYQTELKFLLTNPARLEFLAKTIDNIRKSGNTLVLVDRVAAGKELTKLIPNSVFISGATKIDVRDVHYNEIADSADKVIVATYGVASVGINLPRIFNMVLIEAGKSFVRVIQSIGRGIRKANDKDFVQIWDMTSTCRFSKRHLTKRKQYYREAEYPFVIQKQDWRV